MKKVVAGMLAGFALAMAISAHAEEVVSVVGRTIEGTLPLRIDGTRADVDAIVVDGTSYVPIRAAGQLFGYQVDFVYGEVVMNKAGADEAAAGTSGAKAGSGKNAGDAISENVDYSLKSPFLAVNSSKLRVAVRGGEIYVPVIAFEKYLSNDGTTITVKLPKQEAVSFPANQPYTPDADGYADGTGNFYIKLSALQLKATVKGNVMTLDKN